MYAQCGALARAHEVLDALAVHNVVAWNALIAGYVQQGDAMHAIECYKLMKCGGLYPDSVTFTCILKACANIQAIEQGKLIHDELVTEDLLEKNQVLGTALMVMYAKCGALAKAQQVFDGLPVQNTVSWTTLIAGYAQHGHNQEAFQCFERMQRGGHFLDVIAISCILKVCANMRALIKGHELHAEIKRQGFLENITVAKALFDMYARCGALRRAQELFDELPVHDVVLWTALISGYVEHGHDNDAISCFECMQEMGPAPDSVTFACVLKACGNTKAVQKGEQIHAEIVSHGLLIENNIVGTALIDMYTKCGELAKAQEVFDELPVRDVVAWTSLLIGYTQQGYAKEAVSCFEQMQHKGICMDTVAFLCVLKACGWIGAAGKGWEVHGEIVSLGLLEKSIEIGNALVDMYVKCCEIAKAGHVFDELPVRDEVSWNTVIAGCAQWGHDQEAVNYFEWMHLEGIPAVAVTFACALKACGSMQASNKGQAIHAEIMRGGWVEKSHVVGTSLVDMYAKCNMLAKAREVFDGLAVQDVVSWSSLIGGYAHHDLGKEAIKCFEEMQLDGLYPDVVTFACVLKACGSIGALDKGENIHQEIIKNLEMDTLVGNALVEMYAKCGALTKAAQVFNELPVKTIVSWNALIGGYAQEGHAQEAIICLESMELEGLPLDESTCTHILSAYHSIGAVDKIEGLHRKLVQENWLEKSIIVGTAVVDAYCKAGELAKAKEVFDELLCRDCVLWNTLIAGYAQHEHDADVVTSFNRMQLEGFFPDDVTYSCVAKACCNMGSLDNAREVYARIGEGCLGGNVVGTTLIDMFVKCGALAEAQCVFEELPVHDIVVWNVFLEGHAQLGKDVEVFYLYNKMVREGLRPNVATLTILLYTCSHSGLLDIFQLCFEDLSKFYDIAPILDDYACMLDLFGRAGLLQDVSVLIEEMPHPPNLTVWRIVLGACQKWVNVELGMLAFERAVELNEKDAGTYITMSNIFAAAGLQEQADLIRSKLHG